MNSKTFFGGRLADDEGAKNICEEDKSSADNSHRCNLAFSVAAQGTENLGENFEVKSLRMSVQQTINQQASGGEIVEVKREDDPNGKWNYEVVVRTSGKQWGFELDPNGKFLKKHTEIRK